MHTRVGDIAIAHRDQAIEDESISFRGRERDEIESVREEDMTRIIKRPIHHPVGGR